MKNLIIIFFISLSFLLPKKEERRPIKFVKTERIKLSKKEIVNVGKYVSHQFELKGDFLYPSKGYDFYIAKTPLKGNVVCVFKTDKRNKLDGFEIDLHPEFSTISENYHIMIYCSCGMMQTETEGDNCQHYQTSEGIKCGGSCTGQHEQSTCSITVVNTETGNITYLNSI